MTRETGLSDEVFTSMYVSGLKPEISEEVLLAKPATLMEAFSLTKAYESRYERIMSSGRLASRWPNKNSNQDSSTPNNVSKNLVAANSLGQIIGGVKETLQQNKTSMPVRRLTRNEM